MPKTPRFANFALIVAALAILASPVTHHVSTARSAAANTAACTTCWTGS
jgi:hypothetical protein